MASKYEDRPYEVGKGKPPKANQFKAGQKPPKGAGRPRGAKARNPLRKFLDQKISIPDKDGKLVRMTIEEAMVQRLVHKAVKDGDLRAISMILAQLIELAKLEAAQGASAEDIARQREEEAEKLAISKRFIDMLQAQASAKKAGARRQFYRDGKVVPKDETGPADPPDRIDDPGSSD
jgi:hypothetical protein